MLNRLDRRKTDAGFAIYLSRIVDHGTAFDPHAIFSRGDNWVSHLQGKLHLTHTNRLHSHGAKGASGLRLVRGRK